MRLRCFTVWAALLMGAVGPLVGHGLSAQQAPAIQSEARKTSTPYTGDLSIFESGDREQKLHIQQVMDVLGISAGKDVADIGAGSGWFTVRAATRVASTGRVYAIDINPEAVDYIKARIAKEHLGNVKVILSKPDNPGLSDDSVDSVLLLKTYHEVADPVALLRNIRPALRPGARIGVIDRTGNGEDHGVQKSVVIREATQAGYRLIAEHDDLVKDDKMDYFLVFAPSTN